MSRTQLRGVRRCSPDPRTAAVDRRLGQRERCVLVPSTGARGGMTRVSSLGNKSREWLTQERD